MGPTMAEYPRPRPTCEMCCEHFGTAILDVRWRDELHRVELCDACAEAVTITIDEGSFNPAGFLDFLDEQAQVLEKPDVLQ